MGKKRKTLSDDGGGKLKELSLFNRYMGRKRYIKGEDGKKSMYLLGHVAC